MTAKILQFKKVIENKPTDTTRFFEEIKDKNKEDQERLVKERREKNEKLKKTLRIGVRK